jgi:hypothetical protein
VDAVSKIVQNNPCMKKLLATIKTTLPLADILFRGAMVVAAAIFKEEEEEEAMVEVAEVKEATVKEAVFLMMRLWFVASSIIPLLEN